MAVISILLYAELFFSHLCLLPFFFWTASHGHHSWPYPAIWYNYIHHIKGSRYFGLWAMNYGKACIRISFQTCLIVVKLYLAEKIWKTVSLPVMKTTPSTTVSSFSDFYSSINEKYIIAHVHDHNVLSFLATFHAFKSFCCACLASNYFRISPYHLKWIRWMLVFYIQTSEITQPVLFFTLTSCIPQWVPTNCANYKVIGYLTQQCLFPYFFLLFTV